MTKIPENAEGFVEQNGGLHFFPPAAEPPLAEPDPNSLPSRAHNMMMDALDQTREAVLHEIEKLQAELDHMKAVLTEDTDMCKEVLSRHLTLSAEAHANCGKIARRMVAIRAGGGG